MFIYIYMWASTGYRHVISAHAHAMGCTGKEPPTKTHKKNVAPPLGDAVGKLKLSWVEANLNHFDGQA